MPRTAPKRTRRVQVPFDDRLEVRLYSTEKAKLLDEAKGRGMSASDLVRYQLGSLIKAKPPETRQTPPATQEAATGPTTSLVEAIAEAYGTTVGWALLRVRLGKVTVKGEPWPLSEIPVDLLTEVRVDGDPLP